jgi:hypothetical protein
MLDIVQYIPGKRKQSSSGWISFNGPCCVHNGESPDRRQRGGLLSSPDGWSYHCFNCNFTASFILGRNLSVKARKLLTWLNVPQEEIVRVNLESLRHRSIAGLIDDRQRTAAAIQGIRFEERDIGGVEFVTARHTEVWKYLRQRLAPLDYPYMIRSSDGVHWTRPHVMIPFTYDNVIVGSTTRFIDGKQPVWINDFQPGYVFGTDLQRSDWQHVIVTEGIFDALSISGLALMHNTVSDAQARLIRNLGKEITVVPDQDKAGMELVDRAIELGWAVSMPAWSDCKDVNDAVIKYGRLATLLTIMQSRETSRIKIELRKRQIVKQF